MIPITIIVNYLDGPEHIPAWLTDEHHVAFVYESRVHFSEVRIENGKYFEGDRSITLGRYRSEAEILSFFEKLKVTSAYEFLATDLLNESEFNYEFAFFGGTRL